MGVWVGPAVGVGVGSTYLSHLPIIALDGLEIPRLGNPVPVVEFPNIKKAAKLITPTANKPKRNKTAI